MSKSSNTFIKSSGGLPGFLLQKHTDCYSWAFDIQWKSAVLDEIDRVEFFFDKYGHIDLPTNVTRDRFDFFLRRTMMEMLQEQCDTLVDGQYEPNDDLNINLDGYKLRRAKYGIY